MTSLTLDHVVIAVADLDAATHDFGAMLGRRPSWRGEHPGNATSNTLFRLDNMYLELLGVAAGGRGKAKGWSEELSRHLETNGEGVYALALGTSDIKGTRRELRENGLQLQDPRDGEGVDEITGARREWRNAMVPTKATNGTRIFFIEHKSKSDMLPVAAIESPTGAFVRRMDHAVILSADMEASRRLWGDVLGLRLAVDRTFPDRNTRILFFRAGDITIEISGGAQQTKEGVGKPDRFWGLAWGVDSIEATCSRLHDAGIETSGARQGIKPGTRVATVKGMAAHGVATLLIEHTPESFLPESRAAQGIAYDNTPQRPAFTATGLDHITLATADLDAAVRTWADTLGLQPSATAGKDPFMVRRAALDAGNARLEIVESSGGDQPEAMRSIAIEVDDLAAAVLDLRAKGAIVSDPEPGSMVGTRTARVSKSFTHGVEIELIQRFSEGR